MNLDDSNAEYSRLDEADLSRDMEIDQLRNSAENFKERRSIIKQAGKIDQLQSNQIGSMFNDSRLVQSYMEDSNGNFHDNDGNPMDAIDEDSHEYSYSVESQGSLSMRRVNEIAFRNHEQLRAAREAQAMGDLYQIEEVNETLNLESSQINATQQQRPIQMGAPNESAIQQPQNQSLSFVSNAFDNTQTQRVLDFNQTLDLQDDRRVHRVQRDDLSDDEEFKEDPIVIPPDLGNTHMNEDKMSQSAHSNATHRSRRSQQQSNNPNAQLSSLQMNKTTDKSIIEQPQQKQSTQQPTTQATTTTTANIFKTPISQYSFPPNTTQATNPFFGMNLGQTSVTPSSFTLAGTAETRQPTTQDVNAEERRQNLMRRGQWPQQSMNQNEPQKISSRSLQQFVRSKQEIYNVLANIGQYYLPPYEECTVDFLRDIFSGKKKALKNNQVKIITVPRLQELAAANLISSVKQDSVLVNYLPDLSNGRQINRGFLFNVINTVKPEFFPENIRLAYEQRKEAQMAKDNKYINILPEMYELIQNSNVWSNSKSNYNYIMNLDQRGRALDLLNAGTKKRGMQQRQNKPTLQKNLYNFQSSTSLEQQTIQSQTKRFKGNEQVAMGLNRLDYQLSGQTTKFIQLPKFQEQSRNHETSSFVPSNQLSKNQLQVTPLTNATQQTNQSSTQQQK